MKGNAAIQFDTVRLYISQVCADVKYLWDMNYMSYLDELCRFLKNNGHDAQEYLLTAMCSGLIEHHRAGYEIIKAWSCERISMLVEKYAYRNYVSMFEYTNLIMRDKILRTIKFTEIVVTLGLLSRSQHPDIGVPYLMEVIAFYEKYILASAEFHGQYHDVKEQYKNLIECSGNQNDMVNYLSFIYGFESKFEAPYAIKIKSRGNKDTWKVFIYSDRIQLLHLNGNISKYKYHVQQGFKGYQASLGYVFENIKMHDEWVEQNRRGIVI